jgi:DNA repair photolyase
MFDEKEFRSKVEPRKDILKKLERDARVLRDKGETERILMCFTCDPYPPEEMEWGITREALKILKGHGLAVQVLTKGGTRALRDLDLFTEKDAFATTLTLWGKESRKWEPGAAMPGDRVRAIMAFYQAGIPTWVSLEPVIDPDASLNWIRSLYPYVDLFKVGKLNYIDRLPQDLRAEVENIDWAKFAVDVVTLLDRIGKPYLIKDDLKEYLS